MSEKPYKYLILQKDQTDKLSSGGYLWPNREQAKEILETLHLATNKNTYLFQLIDKKESNPMTKNNKTDGG